MMSTRKDLKLIVRNQRGVALMMIMTSIIILMAIYGEFTFDSKISRIKATNILDRSQAKLLAESGLQMAMARLRLYKEAFNYVQNNQNAKSAVPPQLLNQLWEVPFIYPMPVGASANRALKDSAEKFSKDSLLEGEMKVNIQNISNRLNINMLRVDMTKFNPDDPNANAAEASSALNFSDTAIMSDVSIDQSLFFMLKKQVDEKKDKDEAFEERYSNLNYQELITNLKFYLSDYGSLVQDPLAGEAEAEYQRIPLNPKYGPLGSSSELYSIPGWTDELIELIQNDFSVYPSTQIDFNKITANMLKVLMPTMQEDAITRFFEFRDDPEKPKRFNGKEDFRKYMVDNERMADTEFDARIKLFEDKGISFGSNPNLFKVVSEGTYNRAIFKLIAYVVLPQPSAPATPPAGNTPPVGTPTPNTPAPTPPGTAPAPGAAQNTQLQEPRIIEIQIN